VPGRGEANFPRLPSAAEPAHGQTFITAICPSEDYIDSANNDNDETFLVATINTTWSTDDTITNTISNIDLECLELNLPNDDWIDNFDDIVPCSLPSIGTTDHFLSSDDANDTPANVPLTVNALSDLDRQLRELGIARSDFYTNLRSTDSFLQFPLRAHFDGGSMATTTDQRQYLWFYRDYNETERPQTLQVADNHKHHPVGFGFLCIPTTTGSCFIRCLHTPTLPATIVSPFDAGIQHGCCGYSCASSFDGVHCTVRLHFAPAENKDDICFPQQLHRGLLFSDPAILPTVAQRSAPIPHDLPNYEADTA
jgi:hypothetical protein